jgi:hypothetical protein
MQDQQARRAKHDEKLMDETAQAFVEKITADHITMSEDEQRRHGDTVSLVTQDRATHW